MGLGHPSQTMRVAIVNNGATEPANILNLLGGNDTKVFAYSDTAQIDTDKFDLLVLSGSSQFPVVYNQDKLAGELSLILATTIPTLGICYGCELIAVAFGGTLKDRGSGTQTKGSLRVDIAVDNPIFQGKKDFVVYDAHRWIIDKMPAHFSILARSAHGPEIIKHDTRPIYGFQFHPEKMLDDTFGDELFAEFIKHEVSTQT